MLNLSRTYFFRFITYIKYFSFNIFLRNFIIILFIDILILDDEPLWEPIEWSLVQSWLLFIFFFSWIAETLITGRYGSFTGRDKRVYQGLFKSYWIMELWFMFNLAATALLVIVPFYFERKYPIAHIVSWWDWYNRFYFFKLFLYTYILFTAGNFLLSARKWLSWKKLLITALLINFGLNYLLFWVFINTFFAYFGDLLWYNKQGWCDFSSLSHGYHKWGAGSKNRDPFQHHQVTVSFWFKNDSAFSSAFLFFNFFIFWSLTFLNIQWLLLIRRLYSSKEVSWTFLLFCVSSLRQFLWFFCYTYLLSIFSIVGLLSKYPLEFSYFKKFEFFLNELVNLWLFYYLSFNAFH